ncbi:unnamed protein product [Citrullus colocynthis]|uniref:Uncharacterized protein n=1 Tax=Citrullus colocynthis TaxID=252529 RepID=A0ABP0Z2N4_9ROSI
MWIAQGFIRPSEERNVTMEDVGDKYFNILLSRSLFQDVVKDKRGRTIYCKMHDFIHDVACAISRDGRRTFDYSDKAARKLHMLTFNSRVFHHEIANCICLRVLIADSYVITELPNSIAELKHLSEREEGRSYNDLDVLEGLEPHENLQALRIQNFAGELLPGRIFLSKLEVLEIRNLPSVRRIGDEFCGNYCKERTLFPELKTFHIFEMKSLEHWEEIASISNGTMFPHLQSLSIICCVNLMNIPNIFASCWKKLDVDVNSASFLSFRGHGKLRSLKILGCEKLTKLPDGLEFCSSLENLWISNCSNLNLQNMHSLSCLSIRDFQKLPNGIASLLNLKDLSIHGDLQGYDWNPLIHLRSLESLALANSAIGAVQLPQQLECLTALRSLHISHFDKVTLPEWFGNFTSLEMLKLYNCRNLKNLPSQKALSNLVRLSSLRVYGCSQLELGNGCFQLVKTSNGSNQFLHEIHAPFYW